jgi:hypothetical protein
MEEASELNSAEDKMPTKMNAVTWGGNGGSGE